MNCDKVLVKIRKSVRYWRIYRKYKDALYSADNKEFRSNKGGIFEEEFDAIISP